MSSSVVATPFTEVMPPESDPKYYNPHFSTVNMTEAMYTCTPSELRMFVETPFGDTTPQSTLREDYESVAKKPKVVAMIPFKVDSEVDKWVAAWKEYAKQYIDDTTQATKAKRGKGGKTDLSFHMPLVRNADYDDDDVARIKMTVPDNVLRAMHETVPKEYAFGKTLFDIPRAQYKICFKVTGIWRSATSYGISFKIVRAKFHKILALPKRAAPEDYLFPSDDEEEGQVPSS